ncbi:hypothetical protein CMI47_18285 [Candidatus Pacearchaeota archaeon]|jgi:hypothetical protein|nr:hypothetical protein [Candidatus Pacearchaeota archaeon]|tara:strand:- start:582 stop:899 length:318 start_codon:yes stop_codon:yes gene_type:complete
MNKKELDWGVFEEATSYAENIIEEILYGLNDPTHVISGESRAVYEELDTFKWFEDKPLTDQKNKSFYVKLISMQQYRHMMWKKSHKNNCNKKTLSKWDKVMGTVR